MKFVTEQSQRIRVTDRVVIVPRSRENIYRRVLA